MDDPFEFGIIEVSGDLGCPRPRPQWVVADTPGRAKVKLRSQQQRRQKRPQTNAPHTAHETPDAAASASAPRFRDSRRSAAAVSQPPGHEEWEHGPDGLLLPPHLARYAQPRHQTRGFSGPSVIQAESEEYKLRLQPNKPGTNPARFQQLVTQLKYRLSQGGGECLYCIGVEDNGHPRGLEAVQLDASLLALREMAAQIGASARVLETLPGTHGRVCAVVRVHAMSAMRTWRHREVRVAVAGAADAGKSTLVAVLTHGADGLPALDNGRGAARMNVLRHKHEVASGRTSSVSVQVAGYERAGEDAPLNYDVIASAAAPTTAGEVASASRKLVRLADLSGHGRFSKTSLHGMTATAPDYACVCVSAVQGLSSVTRDHLAVALALGVPPFVVITKVDGACKEIVDALVRDIASLVHAARRSSRSGDDEACPSTAMFATEDDGGSTLERLLEAREVVAPLVDSHTRAKQAASALSFARRGKAQMSLLCVPVLAVSSVSGESIDVLHAFLSSLEVEDIFETDDQGPECGEHARQRYVGHGGFACPHSTSSAAAAATTKLDDKLGVERQQQPDPTPVCRRFDGEIAPGRTLHSETRFQIESSFEVAGVGPVFSGVVQCGKIGLGAELLLGASEETTFRRVRVKGIHRFQVEVAQVVAGQHATIAIDPVDDNDDALSCDRVEEAEQSTLDRRETSSDSAGLYACCRIAASSLEATSDSEQEEEEEESPNPGAHPATSSAHANKTTCCAGMNVPGFHQKLSSPSPLLNDGAGHQDQPTGLRRLGQPRLIDPDATALPDRSTLTTHSHSPSTDETAFGEASPHRGAAFDQQQPEPEHSRRNSTSVPSPRHNSTIHTIAMTSTCGEQHQQRQHQQQRLETDEHCSSSMALLGRSWETASQKWLLKNGSSGGNRGGVGCGAMLSLGSLDRSSSSSSARPRSAHHAAGMTSARWRRGTVLLAPCIRPRAHFVFEAFVVLLGGCWPARGLTSGKYPPEQDDESILTASMLPSSAKHGESSYHRTCSNQSIVSSSSSSSSASSSAFSLMKSEESDSAAGPLWLQRRRRSTESLSIVAPSLTSKSPESNAQLYAEGTTAAAATAQQQQQQQQQPLYVPMVHCGGVRQAAQVIAMEELHPQEAHELYPIDDAVVESCFAAGGLMCAVGDVDQPSSMECALLHGADDSSDVVTGESNHRCTATCAKVTFRFLHRGEWLVPGTRLIVRDLESGRVAGAGAVLAVV